MAEKNALTVPFAVLRDLIAWFKAAQVSGIVIGGIAVSISCRGYFHYPLQFFLLTHQTAGINIDISIGSLPFEQESIERAVWVDVGGLLLPLSTPEDLLISS